MTTLLFITDTHAGTAGKGFCQQPIHAHLLLQIMDGVRRLIDERHVDLLIHGGDITDGGDTSLVHELLGGIHIPVATCLGNHDLMQADSAERWRSLSIGGLSMADTAIRLADVDLIILNNHWLHEGRPGMFWNGDVPTETLTDSQFSWLDEALAADRLRPACVVVHAPPDPISKRLTRLADDIHKPHPPYAAQLNAILDRHPRVKLVLSGHNHVTVATRHPGRLHLTTSSLLETPFEMRLIRFDEGSLDVDTVASIITPADARYDPAKPWVNGQAEDRVAHLKW